MNSITEMTIKEERRGADVRALTVKVSERGYLVLYGHDLGREVAKSWPDDEYEYWRTVSVQYKD